MPLCRQHSKGSSSTALEPSSPLAPQPISQKCRPCDGIGMIVLHRPSPIYPCGFITVAETCPSCLGSGRVMPVPADFKSASAGDSL